MGCDKYIFFPVFFNNYFVYLHFNSVVMCHLFFINKTEFIEQFAKLICCFDLFFISILQIYNLKFVALSKLIYTLNFLDVLLFFITCYALFVIPKILACVDK